MHTEEYERVKRAIAELVIEPKALEQANEAVGAPLLVGITSGMAIFLASLIAEQPLIAIGGLVTGIGIGTYVGVQNAHSAYDPIYNSLYNKYFGEDNVGLAGDSGLVADLV